MARLKNAALTRDGILAANDLKTVTVTVPEWGGTVTVREMTGVERETFEEHYFNENPKNVAGHLLVLTVVGGDGKRLFSDDDIDQLSAKSAKSIMAVYKASLELNGMGFTAEKAATEN